jgi:hypothetical protein
VNHLAAGRSSAVASAERYSPKPKTVWVTRLLRLFRTGADVLDEAIPAPRAGCKMNSGATAVTIPVSNAGVKDGDRAQSTPKVESKSAAKVIPML